MFEDAKPFERTCGACVPGNSAKARMSDVGMRSGDALRAIEWTELTARLKAARELRRELRSDALLLAGSSGASFGDAAESYFKDLGYDERGVNPDALEGRKALSGNVSPNDGNAATGDVRDDYD